MFPAKRGIKFEPIVTPLLKVEVRSRPRTRSTFRRLPPPCGAARPGIGRRSRTMAKLTFDGTATCESFRTMAVTREARWLTSYENQPGCFTPRHPGTEHSYDMLPFTFSKPETRRLEQKTKEPHHRVKREANGSRERKKNARKPGAQPPSFHHPRRACAALQRNCATPSASDVIRTGQQPRSRPWGTWRSAHLPTPNRVLT